MLYPKKLDSQLDLELFRDPSAEYRGTPFWSWNNKLDREDLLWQLEIMKKMGMGGAHIHPRIGMATPYLGEEYMALTQACVQKAKDEDMLLWLYDEDKAPSGAAGGLATKEYRFRARHLLFSPEPREIDPKHIYRHLACYDVHLDESGCLASYQQIPFSQNATGDKWYAYLELEQESPWYNNQTYLNTLDKAAVNHFVDLTYNAYARAVSAEFGKTIPAMFTDEPQFAHKKRLFSPFDRTAITLAWTDDLPETYAAAYPGEDLLACLPELIWEPSTGIPSLIRYHYHDHVCERFTCSYADTLSDWCASHNLALTGHLEMEPTLRQQTMMMGEAMRAYRGFQIPGIDILRANHEYTTAKQAQSAVHQYGREGMLSEMYAITTWDFDFRGHKHVGDWQAALGVTIRVHHLAWVSMEGLAKRDFPAPVNYQSPWWEKYRFIEDHFARVSTAMTRGKPLVKLGVIHPVESCWLHWGPQSQTAQLVETQEENFQNLTQWLLFGSIDFDFISESLLPELCPQGNAPLQVGEMAYDAILVPNCQTLRSTTLARLEAFQKAGGLLIFTGDLPKYADAIPSQRGAALASGSICVPFTRGALLEALSPIRMLELRTSNGTYTDNLLHQLRQDGDKLWLFLAYGKEPVNKDLCTQQEISLRIPGIWKPTVYDTQNGTVSDMPYCHNNGNTELKHFMYSYDTLLLQLSPCDSGTLEKTPLPEKKHTVLSIPNEVPFTLSEPNVLLLDQAEYALDDGPWQPSEEILRLDKKCRSRFGWSERIVDIPQPWTDPDAKCNHTIHLRWHIHSTIAYETPVLAIEKAAEIPLRFNGTPVDNTVTGYYVDKSIQTIDLPPLRKGENLLEADVPMGLFTGPEWAYLLGDFGVAVHGQTATIIPAPDRLYFGDITTQGLPFYGGNITYHIPIVSHGGTISVRSSLYRGGLQTVQLDETSELPVIYPPYRAVLGAPPAGTHTVNLHLYGHRRNSFGPVHMTDMQTKCHNPYSWSTQDDLWSYDYCLIPEGILTAPFITEE